MILQRIEEPRPLLLLISRGDLSIFTCYMYPATAARRGDLQKNLCNARCRARLCVSTLDWFAALPRLACRSIQKKRLEGEGTKEHSTA